jgi:hypothetical protein
MRAVDSLEFLVVPGRSSPCPNRPLIDAAFYLQTTSFRLQFLSSVKSVRGIITTVSVSAMADIGIGEKCS